MEYEILIYWKDIWLLMFALCILRKNVVGGASFAIGLMAGLVFNPNYAMHIQVATKANLVNVENIGDAK